MRDPEGKTAKRLWFWVALLAATTIACAPFMGLLRDALLRQFPGTALKGLAALLGVAFLAAIVVSARGALHRSGIEGRQRWLWFGLAVVALVVQLLGFRTDSLQVDVVEKVHIVQYGLLSYLTAFAVRRSLSKDLQGLADDPATDDLAADDLGSGRLGPEHLLLPICLGTAVGVLDESVQGFFQLRTGDIRDVMLNGAASITGACFAAALAPWQRMAWHVDGESRRLLATAFALTLLAVGGFFYWAHLGYEIHDPEIGRFHSWFSPETLARSAAERRQRWQADPPTGLKVWAREDYLLTEAAWHANHRNERLRAEDWRMAQRANFILERYYDPFLDLGSFRGSGEHRWNAQLKAHVALQVEKSGGAIEPETYFSPVLRERIYPWSKPVFVVVWLAAVVATLGLRRYRE